MNYSGDTWDIYNKISPTYSSPYSAYMKTPFIDIMSFSPERFLSYDNSIVETKPIKGTRPVLDDEESTTSSKKQSKKETKRSYLTKHISY